MSDRLEQLLGELQEELSRGSVEEARREELARWFGEVLESERSRSEHTLSIAEMFRQGHGLGKAGQDDSEAPPAA